MRIITFTIIYGVLSLLMAIIGNTTILINVECMLVAALITYFGYEDIKEGV